MSDPHDVHPVRYLTPREFRPALMQEYIDELGERAARAARAEAERCALVELITRMTNAGMESPEITRRLVDVHTSTIPAVTKSTVLYVRQLATGSKGQETPPTGTPRRRGAVMSKRYAKQLVRVRSGGVCELCRSQRSTDFSHRYGRGRSGVGGWTPSNGCSLCRSCHDWIGDNEPLALLGGWTLKTGQEPLTTPVWLDGSAGPGWWLLDDEGDYHWLDRTGVPVRPPAVVIPAPRRPLEARTT